LCNDDTILVFEKFISVLKNLNENWGVEIPGDEQKEDEILRPFFEQLLIVVETLVIAHKSLANHS